MSAFNDFQKAWAKRFPGCELPKAWEDDVRANLEKRRQKLAELKEELEKEKFYVEYLEQQLADAERVKKSSISKSESCESIRESEKKSNTERSGEADAKLSDSRNPDSKKSTASVLEPEIKTQRLADQDECNSYVTVIEVGGSLPSAPTAKNDSSAVSTNAPSDNPSGHANKDSDKESPPTSLQQKKKPPAPPKKPRKSIPIQAVPPVKKNADTEPVTDVVQPDTKLQPTEQEEAKNIPDESVCLVSEPAEIAENENKAAGVEQVVQTKSAAAEERTEESPEGQGKRDALGESVSLDSAELETDSCDGENIYDTVAGEDADLADETLTKAEAKSEDTGDYVVFSELASEAQSASDSSSRLLQDHQYNPQKSVEDEESPEYATYMNIDYFLRHKGTLPSQGESDEEEAYLTRSFSSDHEMECSGPQEQPTKSNDSTVNSAGADDVFEMDSGVYSSSVESTSYLVGASTPPMTKKNENDAEGAKSETERITMYKCILNSILESEAVYVECLNMLLQYMKALKCTIGTPNQLLSLEDFNTIFYRIPELHSLHQTFLRGLDKSVKNWDGSQSIGDGFKVLASKLGVYGSFLQNYSRAIETVRKCSVDNSVFSGITKSIKLKALQGQATNLEDLLHKPVARVQKNALVLHDLLRYTPENHPDHKTLKTALKMTQCFLNDINVSATEGMFPVMDRAQRHLVKNSFIVELSESHRKLRHLFLFSDVIVCAKYKPSTRQKFTFEVKWFIPLSEVVLPDTTDNESVKENSPFDILSLKSRASNVRDQILKEEKSSQKTRVTGRNIDKHKKKLAELEAQLVLASPNLIFRIGQKIGKTYTFFLSSEFERSQWIEAISILQSSAPPSVLPISPYELQAWLTSCRKHFGTNLGTFLLRSGKDEDLLVGDLHIIVHRLHGLTRPADIYLCFEVDSYGHFFNKAKTKVCTNTLEPIFEQDFIIELEGSQTLRILCYENHQTEGAVLRGKGALELSRSWLTDNIQEKSVSLQELMLTVSLKYEPPELSLRRIPSSKSGGVFGVKVQQVCKKEKSLVPFIIISCIREVEKRGMHEVGIYRVSGSASDIQRLKKSFESNVYEAEQLMKEVDIHSVTGLFKMYLRELPEALFTDALYQKFFHAFSSNDQEGKKRALLHLFNELPEINQKIIEYLLDHMIRINQHESTNKMSLHNLATVFGPTLLRPGTRSSSSSAADLLTAGTVDVMAQAGIFYFFLRRRAAGLPLRPEAQK